MKTLHHDHSNNHRQIAEKQFTSKYVQLAMERVQGRKQLAYNLEVFRRVSENLILNVNDIVYLLIQLELTRADTRSLKLKMNALAERMGLEAIAEKMGGG